MPYHLSVSRAEGGQNKLLITKISFNWGASPCTALSECGFATIIYAIYYISLYSFFLS
jgi:hypothetical protein